MRNHVAIASSVLAALSLISCGEKQWTVKGQIDGAEGKSIVLETSDNGWWYPIDTAEVKSSGSFSLGYKAKGYPDIYRLNLDGKKMYFPIDSLETVTVTTTADGFDRDYIISGSPAADMMMTIDRKVSDVVKAKGEAAVASDSLLKREIGSMLLSDPSGVVAYYIINKRVGNTLLYNPSNKSDLRIIGAVANAFTELRPNDPRTQYLKNMFLSNRRAMLPTESFVNDTVYVNETPLIDIELSDYTGETHSLRELASQGKVVVLNFTLYGAEQSPAYNIELAKIYNKRKSSGFEIYQVSVDEDEFMWKQTAKNLPWITVYNSPVTGAANLVNYNVRTLPTMFVINRKGELVERVDDLSKLDAVLSKYM